MNPVARILSRLEGSETGSVSVELALVSSFFFMLLVGVAEFGMALGERGRLESAAHAGAIYAATGETAAEDAAGIEAAALADAVDDGNAIDVASEVFCQCPGGTAANCSGTCPGGGEPRMYVTVTLQLEREPLFAYPFIPDPWVMTHAATLRVR